ncbi:MAG: hypothetical protein HY282_10500 [Nitrospirae bacterium]|nr:hypothetical protein [Candidatus Manganitrophaceae bacterium]
MTGEDREIYLVLTVRTDQLTGKEILEIAECVKKTDSSVEILLGFSQLLLSLPKSARKKIQKSLSEKGYECLRFLDSADQKPTYSLRVGVHMEEQRTSL